MMLPPDSETAAPPDLQAALAALLSDLSAVQSELLELLIAKRDCMAAADEEGMGALAGREEALAQRLTDCHQRRQKLLDLANRQGLPGGSLRNLAAAFPPGSREKFTQQTEQAAENMRLLQHHSLANWVIAQRTLLHLSQMLEIIATGGRRKPTYGTGAPTYARGSLIDGEA